MQDSTTITVKYSCSSCGLKDVDLQVNARGPEDVIVWMEKVLTPALGNDHFQRSPFCQVTSLTQVMIPITGVDKIGGPAVN
jgi:hypothetical protein